MAREIEYELTFLASDISELIDGVESIEVSDVYIPDKNYHSILRLRKCDDVYEITKKQPVEGLDSSIQYEDTISLSKEEYEAIATSSNKKVEKLRYKVKIDDQEAEIDVFQGELKGLILVDFEFNSKEEKSRFTKPDFCRAEVTQEQVFAGGYLAGKTMDDISLTLEKYTQGGSE